MMHCSICGGPLAFLGYLGKLAWFRCVNCGMECSCEHGEELEEFEELPDQ